MIDVERGLQYKGRPALDWWRSRTCGCTGAGARMFVDSSAAVAPAR